MSEGEARSACVQLKSIDTFCRFFDNQVYLLTLGGVEITKVHVEIVQTVFWYDKFSLGEVTIVTLQDSLPVFV